MLGLRGLETQGEGFIEGMTVDFAEGRIDCRIIVGSDEVRNIGLLLWSENGDGDESLL